MNRRRFLRYTALGASAGLLPLLPLPAAAANPYGPLLETIADPAGARRIGTAFLAQETSGHTAAALHQLLTEKLGPLALLAELPRADREDLIAAQMRRDFDRNDCVKLDGWVLSRTEGALFALAALHI